MVIVLRTKVYILYIIPRKPLALRKDYVKIKDTKCSGLKYGFLKTYVFSMCIFQTNVLSFDIKFI